MNRASRLSLFAVALIAATVAIGAQQEPPRGAASPSEARARTVLAGMAQFLASTPRFSVKVAAAYDAVQRSGEKIEFAENRTITVSRPDRLRVQTVRSDGTALLTYFTGRDIMLVDVTGNVYATTRQTGSLDAALMQYVSYLGMRLPLAVLLSSKVSAELDTRVRSVEYVEYTHVHGRAMHHVAGRTRGVDFQMWIADADAPLLQRIVITYRSAPGQPQYRATLSDWNLAPDVQDATFAPKPPDGAQRVAFAAELPRFAPTRRKPGRAE